MNDTILQKEKILLMIGAILAGFLNGLLGAGGGIILYFTLGGIYGWHTKQNLVISSSCLVFFSVVSLFFYQSRLSFSLSDVFKVGIPAMLGGIFGGFLLSKISGDFARKIFSVVVIIGGILMIVR